MASNTVLVIVLISTVMLLSGILGGIVAAFKNRDYSAWMAWAFLFPPSILLLILLPTHKGPRPRRATLDEEDARDGD